MGNVLSESIALRIAPQPTLGTTPTAEWMQAQIDKGTLQNWKRTLQTVERDIHDKHMVKRLGDVVGWQVAPSFGHDCNKDFMDKIAAPTMRCLPAHPGGKGQRTYRPTAVVDGGGAEDEFTVPALGDLPTRTLIKPTGLGVAANNVIWVTVAGSTANAIKVATASLVAEAAAPANATLDVIGFEGEVSDIELDANGDLISTTEDFTTRGIPVGSLLKIGGPDAANRFSTAAYNGWAWVKSVTANKIELEDRTWTPALANDGDGKKIRIFTSSLYRTYAIDHQNYAEPKLFGELEEPRAGADGSTRFTTCEGLGVNTAQFAAPLKSKITATMSFIGTDASKPLAVADRVGGSGTNPGDSPAQAYAPLATDLIDTANDEAFVRVMDDTSNLIAEINTWTLTLGNNVTAKEVQGTPGAIDLIYGEFSPMLNVQAYYTNSEQSAAATENRKLHADACLNNGQFAWAWRLPRIVMRNDNKTYAANTQASLTFDAPGLGHETTNIAAVLCIFGHVPKD